MARTQDPILDNRFLNFFDTFSIKSIITVALILFLGFGLAWWRLVYSDPQRVFYGMLENSLRLNGVTRRIAQTNSGQDLDQRSALTLKSDRAAESKTTLVQGGSVPATVKTESIGTPTEDFVRYTSIDTTQKKESGEALDFSSVLGLWGGGDPAPDPATNGELYNESVLGIIPFGRLDEDARGELLRMIRGNEVYEIDYSQVKRELQGGRPRYVYTANVDAQKYVVMLKEFAAAMGLNHLEGLDPAAYAGSEKISFELTVDVWSRQLTKVVFGSGQRTEELSGHNIPRDIHRPEESVGVDELQQRLEDLQ